MDWYLSQDGGKELINMEKLEKIVKIVTKDKSLSLWIGIWRILIGVGGGLYLPIDILEKNIRSTFDYWTCSLLVPMFGWTLFSGLLLVINGLSKTPFDSE